MLESLNYCFRNQKKHNLSNLPHQIVEKLQKNRGVLGGLQLGKQRWRPRLGILRVNCHFWPMMFENKTQNRKSYACPSLTKLRTGNAVYIEHRKSLHVLPVSFESSLFRFHPPPSSNEYFGNWYSLGMLTRLRSRRSCFGTRYGNGFFFLSQRSRSPLGPTQPSTQCLSNLLLVR